MEGTHGGEPMGTKKMVKKKGGRKMDWEGMREVSLKTNKQTKGL
jgi:hypothetical protein